MEFRHHDLGQLGSGVTVVVTIAGTEANVQLMDDHNFRRYKRRESFSYVGGHYKQSPVRLSTPHAGHFHVAVDLGGYAGRLGTSVEVFA